MRGRGEREKFLTIEAVAALESFSARIHDWVRGRYGRGGR